MDQRTCRGNGCAYRPSPIASLPTLAAKDIGANVYLGKFSVSCDSGRGGGWRPSTCALPFTALAQGEGRQAPGARKVVRLRQQVGERAKRANPVDKNLASASNGASVASLDKHSAWFHSVGINLR